MKTPPPGSPRWRLIHAGSALQARLFSLTGGRLGGKYKGKRVVVLHHVGAKSGKARITPVVGVVEGERVIVVASSGGSESHPAWFHNLLAQPDIEIEVGRETRPVRARVVEGDERSGLWPRLVAYQPDFGEYDERTDRVIPVVALEPR